MSKSNELHVEVVKFVMNKFIYDSSENLYEDYLYLQEMSEGKKNVPAQIEFHINQLYNIETLGELKKAIDDEIEACNVLLNTFTPPVLKGIDYKLLAEQKGELINDSYQNNYKLLAEQKGELINDSYQNNNKYDGLINLIDTIQDNAVDLMGLPEKQVFPNIDND